jgi:cytidyltransferase-like protein
MSPGAIVAGSFDNLSAHDIRFLEEASKLGPLSVFLWSDGAISDATGSDPKFPLSERRYMLEAVRFVSQVMVVASVDGPLETELRDAIWVVREKDAGTPHAKHHDLACRVVSEKDLEGFPLRAEGPSGRKKVVVTGCYDWFHSGHVRFFEEASSFGDLFVIVGHDANIRLLKGEGHPLQPQDQRRYVVGAMRHVRQALISSGKGWLDADPEMRLLKPDYYVVNEDGDKGEKRDYCRKNGIEYVVLTRRPMAGLPRRSSTDLRGF